MRRLALAAGLALLAGCRPEPDFSIDGVGVFVRSSAPWTRANDLPERLRAEFAYARDYWALPPNALRGWDLYLVDGGTWCGDAPGCCSLDLHTIDVQADERYGVPIASVECSSLLHEIGHLRFADQEHVDPLWRGTQARCGVYSGP